MNDSDATHFKNDLDDPRQYELLSSAEQAALQEWIRLALQPARIGSPRTSYGLKHDFERDAFYVVNGAFKGAMQRAGYAPKDASAQNWAFRIRPTCPARQRKERGAAFVLDHVAPAERERFVELVRAAEGTS